MITIVINIIIIIFIIIFSIFFIIVILIIIMFNFNLLLVILLIYLFEFSIWIKLKLIRLIFTYFLLGSLYSFIRTITSFFVNQNFFLLYLSLPWIYFKNLKLLFYKKLNKGSPTWPWDLLLFFSNFYCNNLFTGLYEFIILCFGVVVTLLDLFEYYYFRYFVFFFSTFFVGFITLLNLGFPFSLNSLCSFLRLFKSYLIYFD